MTTHPGGQPLSLRARWLTIAAGTVALQFSFWPVVGAVAAAADQGSDIGGPLALGLALVPLVLGVVAFGSRRHAAAGALLKAMGVFLVIGLPLCLLDVALGMLVGYGAAGIVALRPSDPPSTRWRWIALGGVALYVLVLLAFVPGLALLTASIVPFTVLGLVDQAWEAKAAEEAAVTVDS
ncbi:hypothetical protein [Euzebya sp.]|uniref:hypothetical protein n=1 Tax=Euzebya sp. TaxID=1971409 RepID=UPI003519A3CB